MFNQKAKETEGETNRASQGFNGLNMQSVASAAGVMGVYLALKKVIGGLAEFASSCIQTYSQFESMQMGLETFFQSSEKGKAVFEDLRKLSNETTFGVDELANAGTQLLNTGTQASALNKTLIMIGNTAQGNKTKFAELTSIYAKIQSTGKAGAMQLQQLAMRGLPIYDVLKKIGVQGTASANDIKRAFEEMTKEGGQFYNAMDNINKTIEGKEGFISDYFREFKVNFAEVTGIAEVYKSILDIVKEAIGWVSDLLLKINENPIVKALFTGLMVTAITTLVGALIGNLIPALTTVIAKLGTAVGLKAMLNPTGALIGLAVGGISAITMAVSGLEESYNKVEEAKNKALDTSTFTSIDETINRYGENKKALQSQLPDLQKRREQLFDQRKESEAVLSKYKKGDGFYELYLDDFNNLDKQLNETVAMIDSIQKGIDVSNGKIENLEKAQDRFNKLKEKEAYRQSLGSIWTEDLAKFEDENVKKVKELEESIKKITEDLKEFNVAENVKKTGEALKQALKNEKYKINVEIALSNMPQWQKDLQDILGLTDKEMFTKGWLNNSTQMVNKYVAQLDSFRTFGLGNSNEKAITVLQNVGDVLNGLVSSNLKLGDNSKFTKDDKMIKSLITGMYGVRIESGANLYTSLGMAGNVLQPLLDSGLKVEELNEQQFNTIKELLIMYETFINVLGETTPELSIFKENIDTITGGKSSSELEFGKKDKKESRLDQLLNGTDVGNYVARRKEGESPLGATGNVVLDIFIKVVSQLKSFQTIMNFITKIMEKLLKPLDDLLCTIADWLGLEEDNTEKQKDLTDAYNTLLGAMKEMEEYYDSRKARVLGEQAISDVTKVNDMILTPQGNFSTSPSDYIIATKNPSSLGGNGSVVMNVKINNSASDKVDATATQTTNENGMLELMVNISSKVANDYANGSNGWDNAFMYRQSQMNGRSVAI